MIPAVRAIGRAALAARPLSLSELDRSAQLLVRRDRNYLVPVDVFEDFAALLTDTRRPEGPFRALSLNGRRWFSYRSTHYDTTDLRTYHAHRQDRPVRYKIRELRYQDTGERQFEIELRNRRGETVKHRRRLAGDDHVLDPAQRGLLARVLGGPYDIEQFGDLRPALVADYQRATLVADGQRVTCDAGLVAHDPHSGRTVRADSGLVLVAMKTRKHRTEAERVLHRFGVRATDFTKYLGGCAALRPELGAGPWARSARLAFPGAGC
ncbi:VTC domain-containing protein [Streptomyces sp. NPDC004111]|uniref:VTC domain-containing protein n=1 Tax=Streptomyces sp. NPDC004111 TaxID=3364690 RepID=UPI0036800C3C